MLLLLPYPQPSLRPIRWPQKPESLRFLPLPGLGRSARSQVRLLSSLPAQPFPSRGHPTRRGEGRGAPRVSRSPLPPGVPPSPGLPASSSQGNKASGRFAAAEGKLPMDRGRWSPPRAGADPRQRLRPMLPAPRTP